MMNKSVLLIIATIFLSSFSLKQNKQTWVAIGDSITYLNDHLDETGNRVTSGYLTRVIKELKNINYINQGHNGWASSNIAEKIDSLGLVKADIYSVFLGTNDWWAGIPIGNFEDYSKNHGYNTVFGSFRIIINKIRQLNSDAKILLITPMQRTDFIYLNDYRNNAYGSYKAKKGQLLEDVANAIIAIGKHENVSVIDLYHDSNLGIPNLIKFKKLKDSTTLRYVNYTYPSYVGIPFNPELDEYPYPVEAIGLTYDGIHPSDLGNEIIANKIIEIFKGFFSTPETPNDVQVKVNARGLYIGN